MARTATSDRRQHGIENGYRSGLEEAIAEDLASKGIEVRFEESKVRFVQPAKPRTYTPDFFLPNGIVIETKGRFQTADRQKHKWVKEQHPDLEIRFVFSRSKSRLTKTSQTTYADWCDQYGFLYADKTIPVAWLEEPVNGTWVAAIKAAGVKR